MSEQRPQSRMVPALIAALVGVLLGALIVLTGVLAGQRGGCCCNGYGSVCGEIRSGAATPFDPMPGHLLPFIPGPMVPRQDFFILPDTKRHDVPLPGSLMLVGAGLLAWKLS